MRGELAEEARRRKNEVVIGRLMIAFNLLIAEMYREQKIGSEKRIETGKLN